MGMTLGRNREQQLDEEDTLVPFSSAIDSAEAARGCK